MLMLILTLAIVGFIAYLVTTYIPMPPIIKTVIMVIIAVVMILYVMQAFGIADIPVPRVR